MVSTSIEPKAVGDAQRKLVKLKPSTYKFHILLI